MLYICREIGPNLASPMDIVVMVAEAFYKMSTTSVENEVRLVLKIVNEAFFHSYNTNCVSFFDYHGDPIILHLTSSSSGISFFFFTFSIFAYTIDSRFTKTMW